MDTLAKLFGGQARVKLMRLFILNKEKMFTLEDITSRSRIPRTNARREVNALLDMRFIKQKKVTKEGARGTKKKVLTWYLNDEFNYMDSVRNLLIDPQLLLPDNLVDRFKSVGRVKFVLVSGIFIDYQEESRVDLLVVCDRIKKNVLTQVIRNLEAEIGKELNYVVFDSAEFQYRLDMFDKLICDILEHPHNKILDSGQLSTYISKKE